jgi:VanZ family protein
MLPRMRRVWNFIYYWLPPLLWMGLIFLVSSDGESFNRSSRILGPFFNWLLPGAAPQTIENLVVAARKLAHVTEYACCAILLWRALRRHHARDTRPWTWREPAFAMVIVIAYAITDEVHQSFVPGRQGAAMDVLLDSLGGALGLLAIWVAGRWSKRW